MEKKIQKKIRTECSIARHLCSYIRQYVISTLFLASVTAGAEPKKKSDTSTYETSGLELLFSSGVSVNAPTQINGIQLAPILKCPEMSGDFAKLRSNLSSLKGKIKSEANCTNAYSSVEKLEDLIGAQREIVTNLIEKSKTQELTQGELGVIRSWAERVTDKVADTIDFFSDDNVCFGSDKEKISLSALSNITLDVTSVLQRFGGSAWGAPISIGGHVMAGFLKSADRYLNNRKGYKFDEPEQRLNYVTSLCTYFSFRNEMDNLISPKNYLDKLASLQNNLDEQKNRILNNCENCKSMENSDSNSHSPMTIVPQTQVNEINKSFVRPLGTYLVRILATQTWVANEIGRLNATSYQSLGKAELMRQKNDFDDFLFSREAPKFVDWYVTDAFVYIESFRSFVREDITRFALQINPKYRSLRLSLPETIDSLKTSLSEQILSSNKYSNRQKSVLQNEANKLHSKAIGILDSAVTSFNVASTFCNFFYNADVSIPGLDVSCESHAPSELFRELRDMKIKTKLDRLMPVQFSLQIDYAKNWVESFDLMVSSMLNDPDQFKLR